MRPKYAKSLPSIGLSKVFVHESVESVVQMVESREAVVCLNRLSSHGRALRCVSQETGQLMGSGWDALYN